VVSADEGSLRESIRLALTELAVHNLPLIAIINKADKKPPEDVDAIARNVAAEIQTVTGKPPLRVIKVSARKNDISELSSALMDLEHLAEPLFTQAVATPFINHLGTLKGYLETLTNRDDLDSEKISAAIANIETEIALFETQLRNETQALDDRVAPVLGKILRRVQSALEGQLSSLSNTAAHGGDINSALGATIRLAVTQGFEEDFNPEMRRYFDRVADAIPHSIEARINLPQQDQGTAVAKNLFIASSPMLAKLALKIPGIGPVVAAAITAVAALLAVFGAGQGTREVQAAEQLEQIRQNILNDVIPRAVEQTRMAMTPALHERIAEAKSNIEASVQVQRQERTAALERLRTELAQGQEAHQKKCTQYRTDLATVSDIITRF
jgi:gas vesicle protein